MLSLEESTKTPEHHLRRQSPNSSRTPAHPNLLLATTTQTRCRSRTQSSAHHPLLANPARPSRQSGSTEHYGTQAHQTPRKNLPAKHAASCRALIVEHRTVAAENPQRTQPPSTPRRQSPKHPWLSLTCNRCGSRINLRFRI